MLHPAFVRTVLENMSIYKSQEENGSTFLNQFQFEQMRMRYMDGF